jgi:hypothetical protein
LGSLLAIARSEACRREQVAVNPTVRALVFVAELKIYVAVYEVLIDEKLVDGNSVIGIAGDKKVYNNKSKWRNP